MTSAGLEGESRSIETASVFLTPVSLCDIMYFVFVCEFAYFMGYMLMTDEIRQIYETNKSLVGAVDRAVLYFREGEYEKALEIVTQTGEDLNSVAGAVIADREYFKMVSPDSVAEMLKGILEASQKGDYVLLADLYEMQVSNFICSLQELILGQEQYLIYDEYRYRDNIASLKLVLREMIEERDDLSVDEQKRFRVNLNAKLDEPFDAEAMLKKGFMLEFTSSGFMTLAAPYKGERIYLHSNGHVENEAFLQAKSWYHTGVDEYLVYGLGLGYHAEQLHALVPEKRIIIYENDLDILRLYCAFGGRCELLTSENVFIIYDENLKLIDRKLRRCLPSPGDEGKNVLYTDSDGTRIRVCVHYPSYRRTQGCEMVDRAVPWKQRIEELT